MGDTWPCRVVSYQLHNCGETAQSGAKNLKEGRTSDAWLDKEAVEPAQSSNCPRYRDDDYRDDCGTSEGAAAVRLATTSEEGGQGQRVWLGWQQQLSEGC